MFLSRKNLSKIIFVSGFSIIVLSSFLNLFENKEKITKGLNFLKSRKESTDKGKLTSENDKYWVNKLKEGGYIIYMRHAERNKWLDTAVYDAAETSNSRRGENEYFADFVCLNKKGKIQAKMINEFIIKHGMKVNTVISSPSCRARQTAEIGFNKLDEENKVLVYDSVFHEDKNVWQKKLREFFDELIIEDNSNVVITAHGSVIFRPLFDNKDELVEAELPSKIEQGGFYVISKNNGELNLEHQFTNFQNFSKYIHTRD